MLMGVSSQSGNIKARRMALKKDCFASSLIRIVAAGESVFLDETEMKMHVDTCPDTSLISSSVWEKLGRPTLD